MEKLEQVYEGKAKKVFKTENPDYVIVSYKDDATAFNGLKKGQIEGKGVINNLMSNKLFEYLENNGIKTHYVETIDNRDTVVDRKSTRLNSSHANISYAVFCLKKKISALRKAG